MIKLISYFLKKRLMFMIIASVVLLMISFLMIHEEDYLTNFIVDLGPGKVGPDDAPISLLAFFAGVLCTVIPIYEFKFKMRKINIDQMYSLPIKREKIYIAKFISGFIMILVPISVLFLDIVNNVANSKHMYEMIYFLPYYFSLVFVCLVLYSTICFFFTRANTVGDGIFNIFAISIFFVILFENFEFRFHLYFHLDGRHAFIYSPLTTINDYFNYLLRHDALENIYPGAFSSVMVSQVKCFVIMTIIGIVSFVLFVFLNKKDKAENSMQISSSWFSYRVMVPYFLCNLIIYFSKYFNLIICIFFLVAAYIAYVIYRRSFKIKKWDYITLASCFVGSIIVGLII